jgi:hypothetical protein
LAKPDKADKKFATDVLKYKWREDRAARWGKIKSVVSPLGETTKTYSYYNTPNEESYVVESPDAIEPADSCAYTIFRYAENNLSAGVAFVGSAKDHYRTVVLGFPFESLKQAADRDELMKTILSFLKEGEEIK